MPKQTEVFDSKSLLDVHRLIAKERRERLFVVSEGELLVQSKEEIIVIGQSIIVVARRVSSDVHLLIRVALLSTFSSWWWKNKLLVWVSLSSSFLSLSLWFNVSLCAANQRRICRACACVCRRRTHARFSGCHLVKQQPSSSLSSSSVVVCQQSFSSIELKIVTLSNHADADEVEMKVEGEQREEKESNTRRVCLCLYWSIAMKNFKKKEFDKQWKQTQPVLTFALPVEQIDF